MKNFYVAHGTVTKNIGNCDFEVVFKTLEEAKAYKAKVNGYNESDNIVLRDSYVERISCHRFKDSTDEWNSEKFRELNDSYFYRTGKFAY